LLYLDQGSIKLEEKQVVFGLPREVSFKGVEDYVDRALQNINLKVVYRPAYIEGREKSRVNIDGIWFSSGVLSLNLEEVERVFPYIITCGQGFDEMSASLEMLERYYLDVIANTMLRLGQERLREIIREKYKLEKTSRMNPGSLQDWPLEQQKQLFKLLGEEEIMCNLQVRLTDSYLMLPQKSVAGIIYPTEFSFESCQLCNRENCPQRRAPFDENKWKQYYSYC